jgi:hypothetical protein
MSTLKNPDANSRPTHGTHVERIPGTDQIRVTNPNTGRVTVQP